MNNKTDIEEDIKILDEIIKGDEDCLKIDLANNNTEDAEHWEREIKAIKTIVNAYYREKARADKLEKEYSKMLTKIDEYEVDDKANKYDTLVEKIKDKIAEEKDDMYFAKKEELLRVHAHTKEVLQELLDTEK